MMSKCPKCGHDLEIKQTDNHSEYMPVGKCSKCNKTFAMVNYLHADTTLVELKIEAVTI